MVLAKYERARHGGGRTDDPLRSRWQASHRPDRAPCSRNRPVSPVWLGRAVLQGFPHLIVAQFRIQLGRARIAVAQRSLHDLHLMTLLNQFGPSGMTKLVHRVAWLPGGVDQSCERANLSPLIMQRVI